MISIVQLSCTFNPMKHAIAGLLLLVLSISVSGQEMSYGKWKRLNSIRSIQDLANGCLLVRLHTMQKSIDKLEEFGRTEDAEKIRSRVDMKNQNIRQAFKDEFDFCPVYFFMSQYSDKILEGHMDSIPFTDADGAVVYPEIESYLVAGFGITKPDTAAFFNGYRQEVTDHGIEQKPTYYADKNMGLPALIIYSPQLIQLTDPFPYYVRNFDSLPIKRSIPKSVRKMNSKLHHYYMNNKYK